MNYIKIRFTFSFHFFFTSSTFKTLFFLSAQNQRTSYRALNSLLNPYIYIYIYNDTTIICISSFERVSLQEGSHFKTFSTSQPFFVFSPLLHPYNIFICIKFILYVYCIYILIYIYTNNYKQYSKQIEINPPFKPNAPATQRTPKHPFPPQNV